MDEQRSLSIKYPGESTRLREGDSRVNLALLPSFGRV